MSHCRVTELVSTMTQGEESMARDGFLQVEHNDKKLLCTASNLSRVN